MGSGCRVKPDTCQGHADFEGCISTVEGTISDAAVISSSPEISVRRRSLKSNFSWIFAGNVVNAGSQWALLMLMAKLGSAQMVGAYAWATAIVMPIITIGMLQLRALLVTDNDSATNFGDYLGLRLLGMTLSFIAILLIAIFIADSRYTFLVLLLVGISRIIDSTGEVFRSWFQKHEVMHISAGSLMLRGIGALLTLGTALWISRSLIVALGALCGGWLILMFVYDLRQFRRMVIPAGHRLDRAFLPHLRWSAIKRILPPAIPMGIVMGLIALQSSIPRLFLEAWHGKEAVGYFSAALYPLSAGTLVVGALGQSSLPRLNKLLLQGKAPFLRLLFKLLCIGAVLGACVIAGGALVGRPFLRYAYTPAYAMYYPELVVMSAGTALFFVSSFLGYALTAARQFYIQPLMAIASCIAAAIACMLLVPDRGVMGGAIAYAVTGLISLSAAAVCMVWALTRANLPAEGKV